MRGIISAFLLTALAGCKIVNTDSAIIDSNLLAWYDASRISAGDWVEYATCHDGDPDAAFVLRYSCVEVEPGTTWVELKSSTIEETFLVAIDTSTGAVKRCWKGRPGEAAREVAVRSIGDPGAPAPVAPDRRLEVQIASEEATLDGQTLSGKRMTTTVRIIGKEEEPVERVISAVYAEGLPFPTAWSRTQQERGPAGGMLTLKCTDDSGVVETRLVAFGNGARRTMRTK